MSDHPQSDAASPFTDPAQIVRMTIEARADTGQHEPLPCQTTILELIRIAGDRDRAIKESVDVEGGAPRRTRRFPDDVLPYIPTLLELLGPLGGFTPEALTVLRARVMAARGLTLDEANSVTVDKFVNALGEEITKPVLPGQPGRRGYSAKALAYAHRLKEQHPDWKAQTLLNRCRKKYKEEDLPRNAKAFRAWLTRPRKSRTK